MSLSANHVDTSKNKTYREGSEFKQNHSEQKLQAAPCKLNSKEHLR